MAPDGASVDLAIEEERHLFEMTNLYPRTTGLPAPAILHGELPLSPSEPVFAGWH